MVCLGSVPCVASRALFGTATRNEYELNTCVVQGSGAVIPPRKRLRDDELRAVGSNVGSRRASHGVGDNKKRDDSDVNDFVDLCS